MTDEKDRYSTGRKVREIALHYFAGLAGLDEKEASGLFSVALTSGDLLADSALRLAEHEVNH